jgi:hypothetical protein
LIWFLQTKNLKLKTQNCGKCFCFVFTLLGVWFDSFDYAQDRFAHHPELTVEGLLCWPKTNKQVFWKVRVWDKDGDVSPWSQAASWTMGILAPRLRGDKLAPAEAGEDWQSHWIGAAMDSQTLLLRREFDVKPGYADFDWFRFD